MADAEDRSFRRVPKLDEDYNTWALLFKAHLVTKELSEPLEEAAPPERETAALERYNRKDKKALAEIILGVKSQHLPTLAEAHSAREAWDALAKAFQSKTSARKVQLTRELATLKMHEGEALMTYVGRAKALRAELAGAGHPVGEDTAVMHVLAGLPPAYKTVTTVLLAAGVSLQWDKLLHALLPVEVEQKESASKRNGEPSMAYSAYQAGGGRGAFGAQTQPTPKQITCWYCNKQGHRRHQRRKLQADKKRQHGRAVSHGRPDGHGQAGAVAFTATVMPTVQRGAAIARAANQSESGHHSQDTWIIDSGASHHMTKNYHGFTNYITTPGFAVVLATGAKIYAQGMGTLRLRPTTGEEVLLEDALYVPGLATNLFSVRAATKRGGLVEFVGDCCEVSAAPSHVVMRARPNDQNQYALELTVAATAAVAYGQTSSEAARLWHRRYSHLSAANSRLVSTLVRGMTALRSADVAPTEGAICQPCVKGRLHAAPFHPTVVNTSKLELVHTDLVGPFPPSLGKACHFVALLDDATELAVASPIRTKGDAGKAVQSWIAQLELQAGARVKRVRCDGAGELASTNMVDFYSRRGIRLEPTAAHTPQQNGKAERLNRTLVERLRCLMMEAALGPEFWAEALQTVIYTRNRAPTSDGRATPLERFNGRKPDVGGFRVWASRAYALKPKLQQCKLLSKVMVGRIVGNAAGGHAYRIYDPATRKVVVGRDVVADEAPVDDTGRARPLPFLWRLKVDLTLTPRLTMRSLRHQTRPTSPRARREAPSQVQPNVRTNFRRRRNRYRHVAIRIRKFWGRALPGAGSSPESLLRRRTGTSQPSGGHGVFVRGPALPPGGGGGGDGPTRRPLLA